MSVTEFLIFALATWRVASLVADEDGPWMVLERLRDALGVTYIAVTDDLGQPTGEAERAGTNVVAEAMICVWCNSIYIGLFFALLHLIAPLSSYYMALPFALSATAVLIKSKGASWGM